ncbi:MFS transporter [Kocuria sp.]|uniref:MFS transporter n=1 Tax=Kocuria sp. TaxID=1871328 RepID=UPI0026E0BB2B|nr:MFS transporter [Kocuria sp.]MDO5367061.1 MFS transporter [Kocuria sp.]
MTIQARETTGTRTQVLAWCLWDTGSSAFHAIMLTFVFTVYLTSSSFGSPEHTSAVLSAGMAIAGFFIALTAPLIGQRSDAPRSRSRFLGVNTVLLALFTGLAFFARPEPSFLVFGVAMIAIASIVAEFAEVSYNAMLPGLAGPQKIGAVSGWGWGAGYLGGIVALAFVLFGFVQPGFLGIPTDHALNYRSVALFSAAWVLAFCLPLMLRARTMPYRCLEIADDVAAPTPRRGILASYGELFRTIARVWRRSPATVYFLLSSAIFRDGLAGIFTFGGVLAAGTFGFSMSEVIIFAVVANIAAALGAIVGGRFDDAAGPRAVIVVSLLGIMVAGSVLLFWEGPTAFWVCGLALCLFVGPAQAASRTYLGRLTPSGRDGEMYGLYATTGRAVSFLAPTMFGIFVTAFGAQIWGVLGILSVVGVGLLLLLFTPKPPKGFTTVQV